MKSFLLIAGGGVFLYLAITGKAKPLLAGVFGK